MNKDNQIIIYQTADNQTQIDVHMENETVWLTQAQMAELFQKDRTVISRHIRNVFNEGELEEQSTCAKFAHMGHDGLQQYETVMYNLDVIISVGYRVKSQRGTAFRIWATKVLKEYMLRGYAINQRLLAMEEHMDKRIGRIENTLASHQEKIDFFVRTSLPPHQGIFYDGQIFDAYTFINDQISLFLHIFPLLLPLQHLHRGADSLSRDSQHSQYIWLIPQCPYGKKQLLEKVTFKA